MIELDFSNTKFNCVNLHRIGKQNKKTVMTDANLERLDHLRGLLRIKTLNKTEQKSYDSLMKKLNTPEADKMMGGAFGYLKFIYLAKRYGGFYKLKGGVGVSQMVHGIKSEPSSVKLLSEYFETTFYRYKHKLSNDKLVGKLDLIDAPLLENSNKIIDVKTTPDLFTFTKQIGEPLPDRYYYQMQGYFDITGKENGEVCFCLTDYSEQEIEQQRDILIKQLCPDGEITESFLKVWDTAYASMTFKRIPISQRIIRYKVTRDNSFISDFREKIDICREWLNNYHKIHSKFFDEQYAEKDNT